MTSLWGRYECSLVDLNACPAYPHSCLAGERDLYCCIRLTNGCEPRQDWSLKHGKQLNGMVALKVRLSVGSLAWGCSCGRLNAVAIYGRLARYLVRFLFCTWLTLQSCELVVLWSVVQRQTPVLRMNRPVVGHSAANTVPANYQSYGRMFAEFASSLMNRSA